MRYKERLLIFGCGAVGSIYAKSLSLAGYPVSVCARGQRLSELLKRGLLYREGNRTLRCPVRLVKDSAGSYDFIFVTVRREQAEEAFRQLADSECKNIVSMINNPDGYESWEKILGRGRLIPAFPGAGGSIEGGVLYGGLTPSFLQKTSFGEIGGERTARIYALKRIFLRSHIPFAICPRMYDWQLCHLAMVVPLGDAIYEGGGNHIDAGRNRALMKKTVRRIRSNLWLLKKSGIRILPGEMKLFLLLPEPVLSASLSAFYCSESGERFIYRHAEKARAEMELLHRELYRILKKRREVQ